VKKATTAQRMPASVRWAIAEVKKNYAHWLAERRAEHAHRLAVRDLFEPI
jgi:hypothetical protein